MIERGIAQARERHYTLTLNMVLDRMGGLGVPIFGTNGYPVAALSIAALSDRIATREGDIARALQYEAELCASLWNAGPRKAVTHRRSDRRRVGEEGGNPWRTRWWTYH